jgi:SPP1 gp7 family putative phage head morphogenesis protein
MPAPVDAATRAQVYLERLKAGLVRDWGSVQGDLREAIRGVMAQISHEEMRQMNRRELASLLVNLQEAHITTTAAGMAGFLQELAPIAEFSALLELKELNALPGALKFNAPTAKDAFAAALREPIQATGQLLKSFVDTWPKADAARVAQIVRTGWAQNQTVAQMVRGVIGTRANKYQDGVLEVSRRHASTVIHTATQHTANAARMEVWENNGDLIKGYRWLSTLDRRTTQVCRSLDGRLFEPGKGPMPPIHPNCRSTTVAELGPEFDFLDEGATRASGGPKPGYAPADENYYDWLKRQPADFQDFAIGPTRGKLFRDGELTPDRFAQLNLDKNFQPLTLAEMRQLEPDAFAKAGL